MKELKGLGVVELVEKLTDHAISSRFYKVSQQLQRKGRRRCKIKERKKILKKAQAVFSVLNHCKDPKELHKQKND